MFIDANLLMADTLTTTTSGASTSYIDSTTASIKLNDAYAGPAFWYVKTEAAFAGGAACTAEFQLQTSNDSAFLDSTTITVATSGALLTAALTANTFVAKKKLPLGMKRYTRTYMVVGGTGVFTTASWSAGIAMDVPNLLP